MELVFSAVSAGGLVGASNQYLCLLLIAVASKARWIGLSPQVGFMESWWFIGIVAAFWVLTTLPAYATLIGPTAMNVVNAITNALSGFVVPASAALLSLASIGVITAENPALLDVLRTLHVFDPSGERIGVTGWAVAGGAAATATALAGAKFLAKPAVSSATGTTGTVSAPIYATAENVTSVLLMGLAYFLNKIDPWLLVALLVVVALLIVGVLVWAVLQMRRLGRGIGRLSRLIEVRPAAGVSVVAEFLVWGLGWLIWRDWAKGFTRLVLWLAWIAVVGFGIPALGATLVVALAPAPFLEFVPVLLTVSLETLMVLIGLWIGLRSAGALMRTFPEASEPVRGAAAKAALQA